MITSVNNPRIQKAKRLHKRAARTEQRNFLVEGPRAVHEALVAGAPIQGMFVDTSGGPEIEKLANLAASKNVSVDEVSPAVMKAISTTITSSGVVAVSRFIDIDAAELLERPLSLLAVLGQVRDPGNAGTIIRTCRAAGVDGIFVTAETVDIYNPKLVRATAGALFSVPLARDVGLRWLLDELGNHRINRVAADPRGKTVYDHVDMTKPTAFVVGNEGWGLPAQHSLAVDLAAAIPMAGAFESLNVAAATAILLFEAVRQRRQALAV